MVKVEVLTHKKKRKVCLILRCLRSNADWLKLEGVSVTSLGLITLIDTVSSSDQETQCAALCITIKKIKREKERSSWTEKGRFSHTGSLSS